MSASPITDDAPPRPRGPARAAASSAARSPGCCASRPTTSPRAWVRRWSWSASPCAGSACRATSTCPRDLLTTDAEGLVARDDVDVVVEVIGGIEPARSLILRRARARRLGGHRQQGAARRGRRTLFAAAEKAGRDLYYEAAVAGAIPILRPLRESLAGDQVTRVLGIVNGTTNFILDRMDTSGAGFSEALEEAQALGYAEADPTADVEGFDAAAKAAILASLAFHTRVTAEDVHREGIAEVTASDVASAREMGCVVKLLAICALEEGPDGAGRLRAGAPRDDPAQPPAGQRARGLQRGLRGERRRRPADVLRPRCRGCADRERGAGRPGDGRPQPARRASAARGESAYADLPVLPMGSTQTRYHVPDRRRRQGRRARRGRPGLRRARRVHPDRAPGGPRRRRPAGGGLAHAPRDADLSATVETLRRMAFVRDVSSVMRVEGADE